MSRGMPGSSSGTIASQDPEHLIGRLFSGRVANRVFLSPVAEIPVDTKWVLRDIAAYEIDGAW